MTERKPAFLILSIQIPGADPDTDDPTDFAEALLGVINEEREKNGGSAGPCTIGLFPTVQWVRSETLEQLREMAGQIKVDRAGDPK